jgi:general secretion pathway protein G
MKILRSNNRGLTLIELVITMAILAILASLILPSARMTAKRLKEIELRRDLRTIRTALDEYKKDYDRLVTVKSVNESGYPKTLQELVDGKDFGGADKIKKKYLRRIPDDPFNPPKPGEERKEEERWGLRSYADKPDSTIWGGEDVYDVHSLSEDTAIDGTKYKDW